MGLGRAKRASISAFARLPLNMSGFVGTLELRYLSKGRSEFGTNDIIIKIKCDVFQGICKLKVELLN